MLLKRSVLRSIGLYFTLLLVTVFLVILIRLFTFAVFTIPSNSMAPTIISGDKIIVNKLLFGARIQNIFEAGAEKKTVRVKGLRKISYNDILVFNFPHKHNWDTIEMDLNRYYVKRCIGLPGDTVEIKNGCYKSSGAAELLGMLSSQKEVSKTSEETLKRSGHIYRTFPYDTVHKWNIKNFGPLYIPKKGDTVRITSENFAIYRKLVQRETKGALSLKNNVVYLNSKKLTHHVFDSNYYFLVGDNSFDSQDSRYWGFLPEYCIVGVVTHIWNSVDPFNRNYRTDRFLKKLHQ